MNGNAVNHGDVRRYDATVAESYDEGLIDVFCPSLSDTVLVAVPPRLLPRRPVVDARPRHPHRD